MRVRIVTFRLHPQDEPEYAQKAEQVAVSFLEWPGLIAKIWLSDPGEHVYGGCYVFATAEDADASRRTRAFEAMTGNPDYHDLEIREYDVLAAPTAVTARSLMALANPAELGVLEPRSTG